MKVKLLFEFPLHQLENAPREDAFVTKKNGEWKKTSTLEFVNQCNKISRGLLKLGIKPGDKIALISTTNRTEWHIMDVGILQIGSINVPVYPTISADDYEYIFNDAEIKFCFVSDKELYDKVMQAKPNIPSLVGVYSFDEVEGCPSWLEIMDWGEDDATQHEVESLRKIVKPSDLATLIYTSGTTGRPKGVMLSHENIVSNVLHSRERVPNLGANAMALSFLPICHIFERMITYLYQYIGVGIYFAESLETIGDNLKEINPQVMTVVPRLVEKVYNKIYDTGKSKGGLATKIFMWALNLVEGYEPYGPSKGFFWNVKYKIANKLVFSKWRAGVGGNLRCMVSGSAALSSKLNSLFWAAGIPILEGYGLTETSPVIAVNSMDKNGFGIGTVGKPLTNLEVKIADDGEIMVKGPSVTKGYYKNEELTKEVFTADGFFKTGDIGQFKNGLLKITDRKKEMFKTSGGKYIAPQMLENEYKLSPYIEQIMVVGEGQKMPCALVQPSFEALEKWAKEEGIDYPKSLDEVVLKKEIIDLINHEVQKVNPKFGHWEQVKKIALTPEVWSIEDGLLTPTLKLKRKAVLAKFQQLHDELYAES